MKKKGQPIKTRIAIAYVRHMKHGYTALMDAVFPPNDYPNARNFSTNGGPPGCARAFGKAIRELQGWIADDKHGRRTVYFPTSTLLENIPDTYIQEELFRIGKGPGEYEYKTKKETTL